MITKTDEDENETDFRKPLHNVSVKYYLFFDKGDKQHRKPLGLQIRYEHKSTVVTHRCDLIEFTDHENEWVVGVGGPGSDGFIMKQCYNWDEWIQQLVFMYQNQTTMTKEVLISSTVFYLIAIPTVVINFLRTNNHITNLSQRYKATIMVIQGMTKQAIIDMAVSMIETEIAIQQETQPSTH